ncbi:peptidoglycan/LPS O-acetylase OafA/YrhL [Glaciihabitans tibetensis]|uniref:Peptidoglycan/LPS O-acetylase OafA/YrhL n=1 Tax=Glaciihabitans tibetensis TaxID=1266600 RepID=A0A2T0VG94_9MICO|nr:acyltransferase family protein [Glaciihabitans tibetensis]PRY69186.1 peptidoglycan/LPS O-acetylase OafA/YrhL [Glaciihabitans tibetensis]
MVSVVARDLASDEIAPPTSTPPRFRPDLQGLRAIAVVAVVLEHVLRTPTGGFVGVDIFFVLSGFLITDLLLREYEVTGRVSMSRFYARRIRRILPSAVAVLAATAVAANFLFNKATALSTFWDAGYAFFFAANWHFADSGTDYFTTAGSASPLQHYWSLAVEEQFYLLWPWILIAGLAIATALFRTSPRKRSVPRLFVGVVMAVIVAASFWHALLETAASPTIAYFSTFTRAWELGAGALLAVAAPLFLRWPAALRAVVAWIGLAGIVAAIVLIDTSLPFPGPTAAIPVAATLLVIAAGIGGPQRSLVLLTNPVSVYVGNISYSLYLWHFPISVFLFLLMPDRDLVGTLMVLGAILVVSILMYSLIEQPLHRSPWLRSYRDRPGDRTVDWQAWRDTFGSQFILSLTGLIVVATVIAFVVGVSPRGFTPMTEPAVDPAASQNLELALQADLAAAVAASAWPTNLSPSLDDAIRSTSSNNPARACFDIGDTPSFDRCTWGSGDAPNHMYLVGDSEALSYAPAFKTIAESSGGQWKITTIGLYGCRFTEVQIQNDGAGVTEACPQRKQDIAERIGADAPQLVVVANAYALGNSAQGGSLSVASIVTSTSAEAAKYNAAGKIVYLAPPPLGMELSTCYSPLLSPQSCNAPVGKTWNEFAEATSAAAAASGDRFISSLGFSCANGLCPAFAGTLPTKYDTVHMTSAYSARVAPSIQNALVALGAM